MARSLAAKGERQLAGFLQHCNSNVFFQVERTLLLPREEPIFFVYASFGKIALAVTRKQIFPRPRPGPTAVRVSCRSEVVGSQPLNRRKKKKAVRKKTVLSAIKKTLLYWLALQKNSLVCYQGDPALLVCAAKKQSCLLVRRPCATGWRCKKKVLSATKETLL
jgi:hypothetical protein